MITSLLIIACCSIEPISSITDSESVMLNGWQVTYGSTVAAEKTLAGENETVTVSFVGDESSINDLLSGAWEIKVGAEEDSGELIFASMQDSLPQESNPDRRPSTEPRGVGLTVTISPLPRSKGTGTGGHLVGGSWTTLTRSAVWWGMSAWTEPSSGNIDLYLHINDWGIWREVDKSVKPGLAMDDVGHTHWLWWADYRFKIVAKETSTYTGWISW